MIVSASPMMNPFSTGSEMKLARKPRRRSPAARASTPTVSAERDGELRGTRSLPAGSEVADGGGRERGGRRHRPGDEVAGAAERRVEDERRRSRVEPDDRGDAGDRRVGERLGDEHRPDREAGDDVAAQPRPVVTGERREEREPHRVSVRPKPVIASPTSFDADHEQQHGHDRGVVVRPSSPSGPRGSARRGRPARSR